MDNNAMVAMARKKQCLFRLYESLFSDNYFMNHISEESLDESLKVPCILHMDSIKGSHSCLQNLVCSYLWEEWKERQKDKLDEDLSSKFLNMRFLPHGIATDHLFAFERNPSSWQVPTNFVLFQNDKCIEATAI
ncbi:hypothetical protein QN277_028942 [Acacia crassicarpa]|uniref:Uncharacterized protein n=1 Tax=Acacia crassicarpa TaxID=499986 RepID=A0AAE1J7P6_9FABA|nr:hypothetical protein QN277_028942 [Acacia crassicarpa]